MVVEQSENVRRVGSIGRRGQSKQENRVEDSEDSPVRLRGRMVDLIDHHVVEPFGGQTLEPRAPGKLRHGSEYQLRSEVAVLLEQPPHAEGGSAFAHDKAEDMCGLTKDLPAGGHE